ncbi:hypothetical protein [Parasitella parasitica]|uniref:Homeobox domain-containing protein n=1 Tax=Parasitella parasitica TaxID=35722 RepID=A0A0B7NY54_9FUNG|nr:hypothetical protein [Parasitella parasitica]
MNTLSASPAPTRKRTHLKPNQVAALQESFNANPLPDSSVRSRLARELAVTERTIQIWFQNRRAKARKVDALGCSLPTSNSNTSSTSALIRPGWTFQDRQPTTAATTTTPRYQATFRTMMTPERFEELKQDQQNPHQQQIRKRPRSSSKPEPKSSHLLDMARSHDTMRAMSEGIQRTCDSNAASNASIAALPLAGCIPTTPIQTVALPVSVLRIGSWTRFAHASPLPQQADWDLVCYASPVDREFVWRVQAEGHHFRIQASFDSIQQLRLSQQIQVETGELVGQLDIELGLPLAFSMCRFGQDQQWVRCGDFTEDKQASVDGFHILQGSHEAFKQALLDLIALAPELASRINVASSTMMTMATMELQPPGLDLCRDFTMSPSATPEPSSVLAAAAAAAAQQQQQQQQQQMMYHGNLFSYGIINPQQLSKSNMSHLMLQAPFFYSAQSSATIDNHQRQHHHQQQTNDDLYQMMIQQ